MFAKSGVNDGETMKRNRFGQNVCPQVVNNFHASTPIRCRESLGMIKTNSVAEMVDLFSHPEKLIKVDSPSSENVSPQLSSGVNKHVTLFNEMSTITEQSDSGYGDVDSGDTSEFRFRSKSVNAGFSNNSSTHWPDVISRYKNYPNFKFEYLKYFGVNARAYLSKHGCDVDVIENTLTDDHDDMRKRTKSCGAKTVAWAANLNVSREVDSPKEIERSHTLEALNATGDLQSQEAKLSIDSHADVDVEVNVMPSSSQVRGVNDSLKSRISKSIKSYDKLIKSMPIKYVAELTDRKRLMK